MKYINVEAIIITTISKTIISIVAITIIIVALFYRLESSLLHVAITIDIPNKTRQIWIYKKDRNAVE